MPEAKANIFYHSRIKTTFKEVTSFTGTIYNIYYTMHLTKFFLHIFLGMWKKLLAVTIFLAVVGVVCGLMLAPNSPYVKQKCRADSIKGHSLSFKFYPPHSDVRPVCLSYEQYGFQVNAANGCKQIT